MRAGARVSVGCALVLIGLSGCRCEPSTSPDGPGSAGVPEGAPILARHRARSALAVAWTPDEQAARDRLAALVRQHGLDVGQPWALTHALLLFGGEQRLDDGRVAVDAMIERWARRLPGEPAALGFDKQSGGVRVEPHRDLVLKTVAELGLSPDRPEAGGTTLAALYRGVLRRAWAEGDAASAPWDDLPWTVQAISTWSPPHLTWTTSDGHQGSVDGMVHALALRLAAEASVLDGPRQGREALVKKGQGIFAYTCGGAHLLQAVATAVAAGHGLPEDRDLVAAQVDLHRWRFGPELQLTDAAIAQAPEYRLLLTVQRLKFTGHWVETSHRLSAMGMLGEDARAEVERAEAEVVRTVGMLERLAAFDAMDRLRGEREQTWLDLIGDSAHAAHGLDLASGAAEVVW